MATSIIFGSLKVKVQKLSKLGKFILSILHTDYAALIFIGLAALNGFTFRMQTVGSALSHKALLTDIAIASFFSIFAFFIKPIKRTSYYIGVSIFFSAVLFFDTIYYRQYDSMLSLFLLPQFQFFVSVADTTFTLLSWTDLLYPANSIAFVLIMRFLKRKKNLAGFDETFNQRIFKMVLCLAIFGVIIGIFANNLTKAESSRIRKQWNRPYIVERFGIYGYHICDASKFVSSVRWFSTISDKEIEEINDFFEERHQNPLPSNKYTGLLEGQNVIFIHAESLQSIFMFKDFAGQEITPNLNRIAKQGFYFDNFYAQESSGTSSDSEFTLNTSLFPIHNGTVCISHSENTFISMPGELQKKGYSTMAMHGNNGRFWNRDNMTGTLGYQRFYSKKDYEIDDVIGMGLSDMSFFKQSLEYIKKAPQPFYSTLITLSNHTPFRGVSQLDMFDSGELEGIKIGNYLKTLHYMDMAIGHFFDQLVASGLADNTVIAIYGDHPAGLSRRHTGLFLGQEDFSSYDYKRLRNVPFILWSKKFDTPKTIHKPMGMIDIFPTMANMLNIKNPYNLGSDIFSIDKNHILFPNGNWIDENMFFFFSKQRYQVFNDAFLDKNLRSSCGNGLSQYNNSSVGLNNNLIPQECNSQLGYNIFKYSPLLPDSSSFAQFMHNYISERSRKYSTLLEVSARILEHDLLRPVDKEHTSSIRNVKLEADSL